MDASPLEIRDALVGYWHQNFTSYPTEYANTPLPDSAKDGPFVSFDIRFTTSETIFKGTALGSTITRHRGIIFIEIRRQPLSGNRESYKIATDVCDTIERKRIGSVVTRNASLQELRFDDQYSLLVVEVPFLTS